MTGTLEIEVPETEAPEETALYRIYGDADLLLYIGISKDFGRRWKQHAKKQPWWNERRRMTVDRWFDFRSEAEAAEQAAIQAEHPKYNKRHAVRLAVSKPAVVHTLRRPQRRADRRSGATLPELRTLLLDAYEDAIVVRTAA